jgi:arylsulfatase A-like enzyme
MENPTNTSAPSKPNIIMITVDQMRFPMNFPKNKGINTPEHFVAKYMPKLFLHLWNPGVRFSNYYTAASDCTAARATIHTGLYAYQTYSMLTLTTYPDPSNPQQPYEHPLQPVLNPAFPTIGKLMRDAGYVTPYFGKWHLSYYADELEKYGYNSHTKPDDLVGYAGQGLQTDGEVAERAAAWFKERDPAKPFFLNVNFINPHDKQWYWGGMQAKDYRRVYEHIPEKAPQTFIEDFPREAYPQWDDYTGDIQSAIDNWENYDRMSQTKPGAQTMVREVFQYQMGGIWEEDKALPPPGIYEPVSDPAGFCYAPTQLHAGKHKAIAPPSYWTKALNSYLECLTLVDEHIGTFMEGVPPDVKANTIFIFTSDHGEYGSSHGLQGKGGSIYEEGILVPFIVYDPGQRMFSSTVPNRNQLCSSVDVLPLIVSMGNGGNTNWMTGNWNQLYGNRLDLLNILRNPGAAGRDYAFHTTDEFIPESANFMQAPMHVIGQITMKKEANNQLYKQKLGVYTRWKPYAEGQPQAIVLNEPHATDVTQLEYYDYRTADGAKETVSTAYTSSGAITPEAKGALDLLMGDKINEILPQLASELQRGLPQPYQEAQATAYAELRFYEMNVNNPVIVVDQEESQAQNGERLLRVWAY